METTKGKPFNKIFVHWRNYIFVIIGLLLVGIILWFIFMPLPK